MADNPTDRYRVSWPDRITELIQRWNEKAHLWGIAKEFVAEFEFIQNQLETRPREWGEAKVHYRKMKLVTHLGFHNRILVEYGVHDSEWHVFIRRMELLPGHPLLEAEE